ncbi:MAG: hypothetical protein QOI80_2978 [Solirubrobacteraceae bacterium]|nr:hypothetical protein [Solirubrobacteraceae bacterium]
MASSSTETGAPTDDRFAFGENWRAFLGVLDEERIQEAERSLCDFLGTDSLAGKRFLDVGSGSGLFSLAAYRLGAEAVHSLDYDPSSVGCTQELRRRYGDADRWTIERGDALDAEYMGSLGTWDVVYSWGVLHHTGALWKALANVAPLVAPGGQLYIAIYNDQGFRSDQWTRIKRGYNALPTALRKPYTAAVMAPIELAKVAVYAARGDVRTYVDSWRTYKRSRGMSRWHDMIDWVGGYPFEVAGPDAIFHFYTERGFRLERLWTTSSSGCNQFVFRRDG